MGIETVLHASSNRTTTGSAGGGVPVDMVSADKSGEKLHNVVTFELDVTVAADDVDDTLNVFIQTKIGNKLVDIVHFTEVLGNGGAKTYIAKVVGGVSETMFENGAALAESAVRNLIGRAFLVRWVIVDPLGADAAFTFKVTAKGG